MPKTAVQTPVCDICGAEVRAGSLFCYNCGGSLDQDVGEKISAPAEVALTPAAGNGLDNGKLDSPRTARRRRKVDRGPVEVVWEPREGISVPFVLASVVLLLIAAVLFVIAMWLK